MFHPPTPSHLGDHVQHFFSLAEAERVLSDMNEILHKTGFSMRPSNPCFMVAIAASFSVVITFSSVMLNSVGNGGIRQDFLDNNLAVKK